MLFLTLLSAGALLISQVSGQCGTSLASHFQCIDSAMQQAPSHSELKSTVDGCFQRAQCQHTPETFLASQGVPKPPSIEQQQCIGDVQDSARDRCQEHFGMDYQFPKMRAHGPPPGPPPAGGQAGGPAGGRGGSQLDKMLDQICPAQSKPTIKQCMNQAHQAQAPKHQAFHTAMQGCMQQAMTRMPQCLQQLQKDAQDKLCPCVQQLIKTDPYKEALKRCGRMDPSTIFARVMDSGHIPPGIAGPICGAPQGPGGQGGPGGAPQGPPPPQQPAAQPFAGQAGQAGGPGFAGQFAQAGQFPQQQGQFGAQAGQFPQQQGQFGAQAGQFQAQPSQPAFAQQQFGGQFQQPQAQGWQAQAGQAQAGQQWG